MLWSLRKFFWRVDKYSDGLKGYVSIDFFVFIWEICFKGYKCNGNYIIC